MCCCCCAVLHREAAKKGADGKKEGAAAAPSVYIEGESDSEEEEDLDYKETEEQNRLIQKHDAYTRTTVRNLRCVWRTYTRTHTVSRSISVTPCRSAGSTR